METTIPVLTRKKIFVFWLPLAATWLMMSLEGPFLAAIIARLADPKYNLAAYGVAFSLALIVEAPIIMIMSASTALVKERVSYLKLRNFTFSLNIAVTLVALLLIVPNVFYWLAQDLIALPETVARLTHWGFIILLPWPAAIGFRRFYQGILIRHNLTRLVAYGTVIRLSSMTLTALLLYLWVELPGVILGATALSVGVVMEALASRVMAHQSIRRLLQQGLSPELPNSEAMSYRYIAKFYYPLALTPVIALGVHPLVTFFMGQSRLPIESLAVYPVVHSLVFIFRSLGISFLEVTINFLGENTQNYRPLRDFALILGVGTVTILALIAFTPLAELWFGTISGLSAELTEFSRRPTQIFALMPGLTVLLSFQRGLLVNARKTTPITMATVIEVIAIILLLILTVHYGNMVGIMAAVLSLTLGRLCANLYLLPSYFRELRRKP